MTYSIPYSFIPGTKARAQEVNANFRYVLDAADEINAGKLNTSLSNITPEAINIIKNCTSFRNIGEIIQSTVPITDSGLHLLDGALLQHGSYGDFVDYISDFYDANNVYDNSKLSVAGALSVSDDGIASGFSASNYLSFPLAFNGAWDMTFKFNLSSMAENVIPLLTYSGYNRILFGRNGQLTIFANENNSGATSVTLLASNTIQANINYLLKISFDGISTYSAKCTNLDTGTVVTDSSTLAHSFPASNLNWRIGTEGSARDFTGCIDLKSFSILVNKKLMLYGNKAAKYFTDEETWQSTVNLYGSCNRFVYDSVNNTVRLPKYNYEIINNTVNENLPVINSYSIVVATSVETDIMVDIDNVATDLNGKADKDLTNVTTGAFEHVLGTAQQVGKDIVINWGMPDYTAGISISANNYVCPCNGIIVSPYPITINGTLIFRFNTYSGASNTPNSMTAPASQGDIISGNVADLKFYPLKGENYD